MELGKTLARDLEVRLASGDTTGLDGSTAGLVEWVRERLVEPQLSAKDAAAKRL